MHKPMLRINTCLNSYCFSGGIDSESFGKLKRKRFITLQVKRKKIPTFSNLETVGERSGKGCPESFQTRMATAP